jgi:hypothetical protein
MMREGGRGDESMGAVVRGMMAGALLALVIVPPAMAAKICIDTRDIRNQTVEGRGTSILFSMRDGSQYRNKLLGACPSLVFEGFIWTIRNPDNSVCDNETSLRVLRSEEVCMLGKFEQVTPPRPK